MNFKGEHEKSPWKGLGVEKKVKFSSRVNRIDWTTNDGVKVSTENNSTLIADFVIVTPSLNVLKSNHETLFVPPLPNEKVEAIQVFSSSLI